MPGHDRHAEFVPRAECPYESADEFAAAVIAEVISEPAYDSDFVESPETARSRLPSGVGQEDIDFALMQCRWSHEMRTSIVISKSDRPLPYWQVKDNLERFERRGQRAGWYPYE